MTICKLFFGDTEIGNFDSLKKLEDMLIQIRDSFDPPNPILVLIHSNGNRLYLAISEKGCHTNYVEASNEPPYFSPAGDPSRSEDNTIVEYLMSKDGHSTEIRRKKTIRFIDLLNVARYFFTYGTRPEGIIEWKMD